MTVRFRRLGAGAALVILATVGAGCGDSTVRPSLPSSAAAPSAPSHIVLAATDSTTTTTEPPETTTTTEPPHDNRTDHDYHGCHDDYRVEHDDLVLHHLDDGASHHQQLELDALGVDNRGNRSGRRHPHRRDPADSTKQSGSGPASLAPGQ